MPTATISLIRAALIWKPRHRTRLRGYGVITAVAYDGARGILPTIPLAPIPFERRPRRGFDFIRPNSAGVGDDGVLLEMFDDIPRAAGWAVMLTLTHDLEHGQQVADAAQKAAGAALKANEGTGVLKAVYAAAGAVAEAVDSILGGSDRGHVGQLGVRCRGSAA